jgi:hypothetical protein
MDLFINIQKNGTVKEREDRATDRSKQGHSSSLCLSPYQYSSAPHFRSSQPPTHPQPPRPSSLLLPRCRVASPASDPSRYWRPSNPEAEPSPSCLPLPRRLQGAPLLHPIRHEIGPVSDFPPSFAGKLDQLSNQIRILPAETDG